MPPPPFQPGDTVRLRHDAAHLGRVLDVIDDPQVGGWQLTVLIGDRRVTCFDDDVVRAETLPSNPWDLLAEGVAGSARDLRTDLTWERLRRPPGRVGATFGSARATLYPYQFKPLVKFLDNPNHVLLVADEVGLGKTIEAAYILR